MPFFSGSENPLNLSGIHRLSSGLPSGRFISSGSYFPVYSIGKLKGAWGSLKAVSVLGSASFLEQNEELALLQNRIRWD